MRLLELLAPPAVYAQLEDPEAQDALPEKAQAQLKQVDCFTE